MDKKIIKWMYTFLVLGIVVVVIYGCKKDKDPTLVPVLTTLPVTYHSSAEVSGGGSVINDGGASVSSRGVCWNIMGNPTISDSKTSNGAGSGSFISSISGLTQNTIYYMRAYATNMAGTGYGEELSFMTWHTETVSDFDGNVYHVVTIGTQDWLVENLNVTHYSNGDPIPNVSDNLEWESLTTGAYCNYDNAESYALTYGRLYNWFAVNDSRNLAPPGWRVSSDNDWSVLTSSLGGDAIAGNKLKETGTSHWLGPNAASTNETGFSGLPGGGRTVNGLFDYLTWGGKWWTSTSENDPDAWIRYLDYGSEDVWRWVDNKALGRSVRCVRD